MDSWSDSPVDRRRRERMVRDQLSSVADAAVVAAMAALPRHHFVPLGAQAEAYGDHPLAIGCGQTISQPVVVAYMLAQLQVPVGASVLDVGSGSGYVSAILARLVGPTGIVFAVERQPLLAEESRSRLGRHTGTAEAAAVRLVLADGGLGLGEHAPYDRIHVACAIDHVPDSLVAELAVGGKMILPLGEPGGDQQLVLISRDEEEVYRREALWPVRFVPMLDGLA